MPVLSKATLKTIAYAALLSGVLSAATTTKKQHVARDDPYHPIVLRNPCPHGPVVPMPLPDYLDKRGNATSEATGTQLELFYLPPTVGLSMGMTYACQVMGLCDEEVTNGKATGHISKRCDNPPWLAPCGFDRECRDFVEKYYTSTIEHSCPNFQKTMGCVGQWLLHCAAGGDKSQYLPPAKGVWDEWYKLHSGDPNYCHMSDMTDWLWPV